MTAIGEHAPAATNFPKPGKHARRFGQCLLGYLAGCAASAFWVSIFLGFQSPGTADGGQTLKIFFSVFVMTGLFASHSAPLLILLGEICKWRSWLIYVGLAVLAAFVSFWTWIEVEIPALDILVMIAGAGVFSGLAFWLVSVRGRRQIAAQAATAS